MTREVTHTCDKINADAPTENRRSYHFEKKRGHIEQFPIRADQNSMFSTAAAELLASFQAAPSWVHPVLEVSASLAASYPVDHRNPVASSLPTVLRLRALDPEVLAAYPAAEQQAFLVQPLSPLRDPPCRRLWELSADLRHEAADLRRSY